MNIRIRNRVSQLLLLVCFALVCTAAIPAAAQSSHWLQFHDPHTGLSFRYPPDLHVRERNPQNFGLPKVETIVDLIGNPKLNPGTVVLWFLVSRGFLSAKERAKRLKELRSGCKSTSFLRIAGHKAIVCVSTGRAAVGWSVEILHPRECMIVTLLGGAGYKQSLPPPHNGEFPLLSIIRTVHFTGGE